MKVLMDRFQQAWYVEFFLSCHENGGKNRFIQIIHHCMCICLVRAFLKYSQYKISISYLWYWWWYSHHYVCIRNRSPHFNTCMWITDMRWASWILIIVIKSPCTPEMPATCVCVLCRLISHRAECDVCQNL